MDRGDEAPDFELPDQFATPQRLSELVATGPIALFFYPMALTKGCTAESCHFRDVGAEFAALGAGRVGISADPVDKQRRFSDLHGFDYPLLSDPDGVVARQFGVKRGIPPLPNKRWTFVIDTDRRILGVIKSELRMNEHADEALALLRRRADAASSSAGE